MSNTRISLVVCCLCLLYFIVFVDLGCTTIGIVSSAKDAKNIYSWDHRCSKSHWLIKADGRTCSNTAQTHWRVALWTLDEQEWFALRPSLHGRKRHTSPEMTKPSALQLPLFTSDLGRCHCGHPAAHSPHTNCWGCLVIAQACCFPVRRISLATVVAGIAKK